ncbi:MAG: PspC domain-containing protein [Bacteroidales bacterium]|nr:PspC domain-containing protein [Candidatus Cryptobacteroides caccocaballi]
MAKKIYRIPEGKMIAGVCTGIADYFDIDPTIVRLAWLVAFFCAGAGFFAYLIAAIIIPARPDIYIQ